MRRRLLALGLACMLALLGCVGILAYVNGADERAVAGKKPVTVLVATALLPAGTTGAQLRTGGHVQRVIMPEETIPSDALGSIPSSLDNLTLTADIQPRQLLLKGQLGKRQSSTGGLKIPAGKLAVSIETTRASRVAGYVRPGSEVAVFYTYKPASDATQAAQTTNTTTATRVLVSRAAVIAVGEKAGSDASAAAGGAANTVVVTLAADQQDAERLVQASQTGTLSLGLLNDAVTVEPGVGVTDESLFR